MGKHPNSHYDHHDIPLTIQNLVVRYGTTNTGAVSPPLKEGQAETPVLPLLHLYQAPKRDGSNSTLKRSPTPGDKAG